MFQNVVIIVPAFNEEARLADVIASVRTHAPGAEVVVIDDGSSDATAARAIEAGATVVPLPFNMGYGVALQTGYKYALERGCDFLVQLDGDGQHDPRQIPQVLKRVTSGEYDICIGSRFLEGEPYRIPALRRAGMILFRRVASWILGQTVTDPTSGFQAMNRRVVGFFCHDHYPVDYPDTDVLVMLYRHGFRIAEAPVVMRAATSRKSLHAGFRPMYYLFKMALVIPLNLLRKEPRFDAPGATRNTDKGR